MLAPTPVDAISVVERVLGAKVREIERFPTGLRHYVYDVTLADGRRVVARLTREDTREDLAGGIYWHARLREVGVPIPALLYADAHPADGFPVMLLERLPGRDLGFEYATLTSEQKCALAQSIVTIQQQVATLPPARSFGFARSYDDAALQPTWTAVVRAELDQGRKRITEAGVVDARHVERVAERVTAFTPYLNRIEPRPFLDDLTTKNVLIYNGALSGIVDTDYVCFGDPLFTVALTHMALLSRNLDTDYIDYWRAHLPLTEEHERALILYTAVFCVNFLGEIGQRFNQDAPARVDSAYAEHLEAVLERLLRIL